MMDPMTQGQLKEWFLMLCTFGLFGWCSYLAAAAFRRKQKNDMQKHMLEKFSSAQDFAEFVQSPAGQKYVMSFSEVITDSRNTILNSLRTGIILVFLGAGCAAAPPGVGAYTKSWLDVLGNVLILAGSGFVIASVVAHFVAKKMSVGDKE
jgi:hypothetical protein